LLSTQQLASNPTQDLRFRK